jgi:hypothetical protein
MKVLFSSSFNFMAAPEKLPLDPNSLKYLLIRPRVDDILFPRFCLDSATRISQTLVLEPIHKRALRITGFFEHREQNLITVYASEHSIFRFIFVCGN